MEFIQTMSSDLILFSTQNYLISLAFQKCNDKKHDNLPTEAIFDMVKKRNKKLLLKKDYTDNW
jgi:hypothetical protein